MSTIELTAFPEELLEGILSHCVVAPLVPQTRPSWHRPSAIGGASTSSTPPPVRGRLAFLLVCKQFYRICTPLFYHTLHLSSPNQLHRLLNSALRPNPSYGAYIRRVILGGIWAEGGELLRMCKGSIRLLDIMLDITQLTPSVTGQVRDLDAEEFCEGLQELAGLTHLVVRKPTCVYLTQPKPRYVLSEVARAMDGWDDLEFVDLAFRLTDDSGMLVYNNSTSLTLSAVPQAHLQPLTQTPHQPQPQPLHQAQAQAQPPAHATRLAPQQGPITLLTQSLSTRPKLHTFSTLLPSVWNETILRVSSNPALERIILGDGHSSSSGTSASAYTYGVGATAGRGSGGSWSGTDFYAAPVSASLPTGPTFESGSGQGSILGTGLFFAQARKHARLSELIRAGTSIIRTRAQTLGTPPSPSSLPILPAILQRAPIPATARDSSSTSSLSSIPARASANGERNACSYSRTVVPTPSAGSSQSGSSGGASSSDRDGGGASTSSELTLNN